MEKTIEVQFDSKSLPAWAQIDENVVKRCKSSLSFRTDVFLANTRQARNSLKREAAQFYAIYGVDE